MYIKLVRAAQLLALSAIFLCLASLHAAERTFSATYELTNVVTTGSNVRLTITLNLFNAGSADLTNGTIVVFEDSPHPIALGSFSPIILLRHSGQTTVTNTFTVPASVYAGWSQGHPPIFQVFTPGAAGVLAVDIQASRLLRPAVTAE